MAGMQHGGKTRRDSLRRGHSANVEWTLRTSGDAVEFLLEKLLLMQHAARTGQHALALAGETDKGAAPVDDDRAEFLLQRANGVGECGLRDKAGLGRARKVLMLVQSDQIAHRDEEVHDNVPFGLSLSKPMAGLLKNPSTGSGRTVLGIKFPWIS